MLITLNLGLAHVKKDGREENFFHDIPSQVSVVVVSGRGVGSRDFPVEAS